MDFTDLDRYLRTVWLTLASSAGLGVVSMAVVQLLKDLSPIRTFWQRRWIEAVVDEQARKTKVDGAQNVLPDLINLATAGNARALYGLPINQLAGQLNAAAGVVLDSPPRHPNLFRVMAAGADADDLATLLAPPPQARTSSDASPGDKETVTRFVDARNRVAHQVQRNLDALQIAMTFRWQLYLQLLSIAVSGAIAAVSAVALFPALKDRAEGWVGVVVMGILGGFFSTVARDLVAALRGLRGRN